MSEHDKLRQDALAPSVATLGEEELHAYLVALVHNAGHSASYEHVDDVMEWVASKVAECKAAAAHIEAQAAEIARQGEDSRRLDWLEAKHVEVREPLVYGSRAMFHACPDDEEDEHAKSNLRAAIDDAMRGGAE